MMQETALTDASYDSDETEYPPERWAPLGATASPPSTVAEITPENAAQQLQRLEEEQDQLNSSLLALTTHFAQVQFRLKQIVSAPTGDTERLLKELEEFAFKGIPDVRGLTVQHALMMEGLTEKDHQEKLADQREKQEELIKQLKEQLTELEKYAYETGGHEVPTTVVLEKQGVVIEELKNKLKLNIEDYDKLSSDDLRTAVDTAIGQIVSPVRLKERLVDQLKTQITDLERFIDFLQGEGPPGTGLTPQRNQCICPVHNREQLGVRPAPTGADSRHKESLHDTTLAVMKRALAVMQIFAITHFSCGNRDFERNVLKRTMKGNHWGDLRARLEMAIDRVIQSAQRNAQPPQSGSDYASDSDESEYLYSSHELTALVRKELATALRDLIQHGLIEVTGQSSVMPFGCFSARKSNQHEPEMMHAWDLVVKYYELKHGRQYNETPVRKLSQAFDLNMVGGKAVTSKQTLLSAVDMIIATHGPLKRSPDAHFKAFVCLALNQKKLNAWFRLVLRNSTMVDFYYQPWSYVAKTGFEDAFAALERLSPINFHLPVDLSVRQIHNISEAF